MSWLFIPKMRRTLSGFLDGMGQLRLKSKQLLSLKEPVDVEVVGLPVCRIWGKGERQCECDEAYVQKRSPTA
ncbi:hypothetical protein, partial [Salinibacter ruber]|uniref:hypothetical protein n=1 Tax=Salinibacter ruber TaxID=146919 RepID=UPI0021699B4D